jgi:hypothetical protein
VYTKTNTALHYVLRNKINVTQFARQAEQDNELFSGHNMTPEIGTRFAKHKAVSVNVLFVS